uniref:NADH-ubiquinone oxidoreductase chain 2 n=1 Tax=Cyanopterus ninghais TaxID=3079913 RepID=A0AA96Q4C4_9HYME|nr:NADH dehydrogenase subunit 2 [Cyanopterus ninghais]
MLKKYNLLYLMMYMLSSFLIFYMNNYYSMWILMELNLLLFIIFLIMSSKFLGNKIIKYYLINSFGSMIFLFFINMNLFKENLNYFYILNFMMMLKLGMFPFHHWFIDLMINLNWLMCFFLSTWQKLIPLMILMYFYIKNLIILLSIMGSLFSLMMVFNQIYLKKLMGYSSIIHLSWLMLSILLGMKMWMIYFFIYSLTLYFFMIILNMLNFNLINEMYMYMNIYEMKILMFLLILSIGGIPPMFGFLIKMLFLNKMIELMEFFMLMILIFCSLVFLFYYIRLMFNMMMIESFSMKFYLNYLYKKINYNLIFYIMMFLLMNLLMMIFWMF